MGGLPLEYDGHKVFAAYSGSEAKEVFQPNETNCILADNRLPDTTGVQLLRDLREISQNCQPPREIPAIAVTANVMPEDLEKYAAAGFNGVVSKPLDEQRLFGAIRAAIGAGAVGELRDASRNEGQQARLKELLGVEEFERVRAAFRGTLEECFSGLKEAVAEGDGDRIKFISHQIAGSAASFGETNLAQIAKSVEKRLARKDDVHQLSIETLLRICELVLIDFKGES